MQLIESLEVVENLNMNKSVVTTGFFDGLHLGHQQIINQVIQRAQEQQMASLVLTYWPHPKVFFKQSEKQQSLLLTKEEKIDEFAKFPDLDFLCILPFNRAFSRLTAAEFVQHILIEKLNTSEYILGFNHHFGKQREGNYEFFSKKNFDLCVRQASPLFVNNQIISSSKIRFFLQKGQVKEAGQMLGNRYKIKGRVIRGAGIGRTLGFATANLSVPSKKLIPQKGVYSAVVRIKACRYKAILNIGYKPTFLSDTSPKIYIEVHLLNFEDDLYDKFIEVEFVKYLRDEKKFEHKNDLIRQIKLDIQCIINK